MVTISLQLTYLLTYCTTCTMYYIPYILKYLLLGLLIRFICKKYISTTKERKENKSKKHEVRNKKVNFLSKAYKNRGIGSSSIQEDRTEQSQT